MSKISVISKSADVLGGTPVFERKQFFFVLQCICITFFAIQPNSSAQSRPRCAPNFHGGAPVPHGTGLLSTLSPDHPRLYFTREQVPALRGLVQTDPHVKLWYNGLQARAEQILSEPEPTLDNFPGGRLTFANISILAGLYALDGDVRKRERVAAYLRIMAQQTTWNPPGDFVYLENSERIQAAAVGYDWLYHELSLADRTAIRKA
ncbi:MAG: hypothetical protein HY537_06510 [Deltaproteobacteria bacterium]|nr:hypothetical protein [Deltaproteobacteria bacterium]